MISTEDEQKKYRCNRSIQMTPYERVMAVLADKPADVLPAITPTSVVTAKSLVLAGTRFPEAHLTPLKMAQLAAVGHDHFGFDSVAPYFSVHLESAALGSKMNWTTGGLAPTVIGRALETPDDLELPDDFLKRMEFQRLLQAIALLRKKYRGHVPIIGKVVGPWTLAYNLYGVENLVVDTILEPERTKKFINTLLQVPIAFAKAQFDAGADLITWADHTTADIISKETYAEFVQPAHKKATQMLCSAGPLILHVCGNVIDRLPLFAGSGFTAIHLDSRNDQEEARHISADNIQIAGFINNPRTLVRGTIRQIRQEVASCRSHGIRLIAPECALPLNVPEKNLTALVKAIHQLNGALE